jgi:hypothetical protein
MGAAWDRSSSRDTGGECDPLALVLRLSVGAALSRLLSLAEALMGEAGCRGICAEPSGEKGALMARLSSEAVACTSFILTACLRASSS